MSTESETSSGATSLVLRYAARSDVGMVRSGNEDSGFGGGHLLVVADGMGGHAAGELASSTAVAMFAELDQVPPGEQALTALSDAVENTHHELARVIAESPDFAGMGTTVTALSWEGDRVAIAHVGDSRAYLLRDGQLSQLTKDHTFVQTLVDANRITPAEAAIHPKRNLLTKALDGVSSVEPDISIREVRAGDRFLLCSDGLSGVVNDAELLRLLGQGDPTGAVTALVEKALEGGAPDNVTCVVADLVSEAGPPPDPSDYPMPVVVGAAAEPRNRSRLPAIVFPADSQLDPDVDATQPPREPAMAANGQPKRRSRRLRNVVIALSCIAVVLIALVGGWAWIRTQYYVGSVNGNVGIYQGIQDGFGPHGFSEAIQISETKVDELPTYSQERVNQTIPASSLDNARSIVSTLENQAAQCQARPQIPGCPDPPPVSEVSTP